METKNIQISYLHYTSLDELSDNDVALFRQAQKAAEKAYAPYSHFCVGVALLLNDGTVLTANNQENIAYPSGLCAERVALFSAFSQFKDIQVDTMVVVAKYQDKWVKVSPCGACRQVMAEYEKLSRRKMRILFTGAEQSILFFHGVESLLPIAFEDF